MFIFPLSYVTLTHALNTYVAWGPADADHSWS